MSVDPRDKISALAKRAIDTLFVSNPQGTSLGVLTGIGLHGMLDFAGPLLSKVESVRFSAIQTWHLCAFGIVGFNISPYRHRSKIDPRIEEAISFIDREAQRLNLPEWQRRKMYENLFAKILASVVLDDTTRGSIEAMRESFAPSHQDESNSATGSSTTP